MCACMRACARVRRVESGTGSTFMWYSHPPQEPQLVCCVCKMHLSKAQTAALHQDPANCPVSCTLTGLVHSWACGVPWTPWMLCRAVLSPALSYFAEFSPNPEIFYCEEK